MPFWQLASATSSRAESPIFDISFILLTKLISLLLLRVLLYGTAATLFHALYLSRIGGRSSPPYPKTSYNGYLLRYLRVTGWVMYGGTLPAPLPLVPCSSSILLCFEKLALLPRQFRAVVNT